MLTREEREDIDRIKIELRKNGRSGEEKRTGVGREIYNGKLGT